jgi:16S rRNA (cytidine1402-2'-O)-methyltransferase
MRRGKLYLVPAPLSDSDISDSLKVRETINRLRYFVVEDLRTARRYLSKLKISTPIDELHFSLFNEHTDMATIPSLLAPVYHGNDVGLLSDAGMPCIADPGEELVRMAHNNDIIVVPLTGSSSIFLALAASGLSGERFAFEGYLPANVPELIKTIKRLEQQSRQDNQSKIFIETPYRSSKLFDMLLTICSPETSICVSSAITSPDEYIRTRRVEEWRQNVPELNKKPCIFILQANIIQK